MFASLLLLSIVLARFCYDVSWRGCTFCALAGYTTQHISALVYDFFGVLIDSPYNRAIYGEVSYVIHLPSILIFILAYASIFVFFYFQFATKLVKKEDVTIKNLSMLLLLLIALIVEIYVNSVLIYSRQTPYPFDFYCITTANNAIACFALIIMQFGILLQKNLSDELDVVYRMWRQEKRQFEISKETIDLINLKCHDLRHQIHTIRTADTIDPNVLQELEDGISIYDSIVKTGNQSLDIILTEKSLYCKSNDIQISYIIDGARLSFMRDTDVYSLFGNLLDNAIHAVLSLPADMRYIGLTIRAENQLLSINSHNYFSGVLQMENGMPLSMNKNTGYHGFGVKSMTMIVHQYSGDISFEAEDQVFNLNILIPIPRDVHT